jgi:opacity protein-like surface antigen
MKLISGMKSKWALVAVALAGSIIAQAATAAGPILKSGDVSQAALWYGRAGGLVGPDRIAHLQGNTADAAEVAVTYDKDVAARTNMATDRESGASVAISYDKDVAERTNMPRGQETQPIQAAQTNK